MQGRHKNMRPKEALGSRGLYAFLDKEEGSRGLGFQSGGESRQFSGRWKEEQTCDK